MLEPVLPPSLSIVFDSKLEVCVWPAWRHAIMYFNADLLPNGQVGEVLLIVQSISIHNMLRVAGKGSEMTWNLTYGLILNHWSLNTVRY